VSHATRRTIATLIVLSLAAPSLSRAIEELPTPDLTYLEAAVQARLAKARTVLTAALEDADLTDPQRGRLYGETGEIFQAADVAVVAAACYRNAIELAPENAKWHHLSGWLAEQQSDLDAAETEYERAHQLEPADPWHAFRLAQVQIRLNQLDPAEAILHGLDGVEAMQAAVEAALGRIAAARGHSEEAIDHYESALQLQPDADQLRFPLAAELQRVGRPEEARTVAAKAGTTRVRYDDPIVAEMQAQSTSSNAYTRLAVRAIRSGHLDAAEDALNEALDLDASNNRARLNLGVVEMQLGHLDRAESLMRQALQQQPDYGYAHFNLAQLLEKRGDLAAAKDHYAAAVQSSPREVEFNFRYGALLTRMGDYAGAVDRYRAVITEAPAFVQARYLEALALVALGRSDEARDTLEKAVAVAPGRSDLESALARVIASSANASAEDGQRALGLAARLYQNEKSAESAETLAMALAKLGRFEEAVRLQQAVISAVRTSAPPSLLDHLQHNLARYQKSQPADEPWAAPAG